MSDLSVIEMRGKIQAAEDALKQVPGAITDWPTTHHFADGMYAREIFIPKDTMLTGKIHKTDHINVISQGHIVVMTDEGMREVKAPFTFVAKAGTKRIGYTLEDTVWTTFHASKETDLEKLEAELIAPDFQALGSGKEQACLG